MKARILFVFFILCLTFSSHAFGARKAEPFTLIERTYDDRLLAVYKTTSVDYRSTILIRLADTVTADQPRIGARVEVIRANGGRYEIPTREMPQSWDSAGGPIHIRLRRWAVEPGDKLHITIHSRPGRSEAFERYVAVERHGLGGDISFPVLSVQRDGDHPGTLGAGISYTLKYVQAERTLLNHLGLGFNLSFLDFDPDQRIEIGLGLAITFPDDLFQIGLGKNLALKRDSGYYFLGINLPGIKEKIGL
jgi:hypothetical protein